MIVRIFSSRGKMNSVHQDRWNNHNEHYKATARPPVTLSLDINPIKIALAVGS
jgi:hypothetical protein